MGDIEKHHRDRFRRRTRRVAAAGFGAALTLPLAAPAAAMIPAEEGGTGVAPASTNPDFPTPEPPPRAAPAPASPTPARATPAPTPARATPTPAVDTSPPQPAPQVTPQRQPTPQSVAHQAATSQPQPAAPRQGNTEPVARPARAAQPAAPPDTRPASTARPIARPAASPASEPAAQPTAQPVATAQPGAQPAQPTQPAPPAAGPTHPRQPAAEVTPQRQPTPQSVARAAAGSRPPVSRGPRPASTRARTQPQPQPVDPAPPTTSLPAPPTTSQPALPTTSQPKPPTTAQPAPPTTSQPTPPTTSQPTPPTTPPPQLATPTVFGMDSRAYHRLSPADQQAIEDGFNARHHPEFPQPPAPVFTPQPGGQGPKLGVHQAGNLGTTFPDPVSLTCQQSVPADPGEGPCGAPVSAAPEPARPHGSVRVTTTSGTTSNRSDPVLGEDGVHRTSLDVTTTFEVRAGVGIDAKALDASGSVYTGDDTTYRVTVGSDRADRIENGTAQPPNPYDPRTLAEGEGIAFDRRTYRGSSREVGTGFVTASDDHQTSDSVSTAVQRVDATTARVLLGDKQSVANALSAGAGNDALSVALSISQEMDHADLKSVDLDLSTPAGWADYQRFVADGKLPAVVERDQPGVVDAATAHAVHWHGSWDVGVTSPVGSVTLAEGEPWGGSLGYADHPDGTTDSVETDRVGDLDLFIRHTTKPDGFPGASHYSVALEDVDPTVMANLTAFQTGRQVDYDGDRDARLSFTDDDLYAVQDRVIDGISKATSEGPYEYMSPAQVREQLRGDEYAPLPVSALPPGAKSIAAARTPGEILSELYTTSAGNPAKLIEELTSGQLAAGYERDERGNYVPAAGTLEVYEGE